MTKEDIMEEIMNYATGQDSRNGQNKFKLQYVVNDAIGTYRINLLARQKKPIY